LILFKHVNIELQICTVESLLLISLDNSVVIANRYSLGGAGIESVWARFSAHN